MKALLLLCAFSTAALSAQTYNLSQHGRRCGADLAGQVVQTPQGHGIRFALDSRLDNSLAVLVIGSLAPAPVNLPGGMCQLMVDHRATMLGMTNAAGRENFAFRIPPVLPISILFQAVVVDSTPLGRRAASSDLVRLRGQ